MISQNLINYELLSTLIAAFGCSYCIYLIVDILHYSTRIIIENLFKKQKD